MARETQLDPQDGYDTPPPKRFANFGTIGRRSYVRCAGFAGETCRRDGTLKGGKLWYCVYHAPRGSEG